MKLDELAQLAGVSRTTASYVINGKAKQYRVSDKTIEKVLAIAKQHQFQPNAVAAGLRAGKTHSIGLVVPDLANISYARIAHYLECAAREKGYQLLIACSEDNPNIEQTCLNHLQQRRVDAMILSSANSGSEASYVNWNHQAVPLFALDRALAADHFSAVIGSDFDDAQRLASACLDVMAGTRICYIGAKPNLSVSQQRLQGFDATFAHQNNTITYLTAANFNRQDAAQEMQTWLEQHDLPDAIFATSFTLLQGVIDAIINHLGSLPAKLTLATFGDDELLDFLPCAVVTAQQQHQQVAKIMLEQVLACIQRPSPRYVPKTTVIERQLRYRGRLSRHPKV